MSEYLQKIFRRRYERSVGGNYIYTTSFDRQLPHSLINILNIDENYLTDEAKEFLGYVEEDKSEIEGFTYLNFKWKVLAFVNIQDIFSFENVNLNTHEKFSLIWYFYFESKRIFKEMVLCCSLGFNHSYNALKRLFYEFNLLQCYYYNITQKANNYSDFVKYTKTGIRPSKGPLIKNSVPQCQHSKKLNEFSNVIYAGLSNTSSHSYSSDNSPFLNGGTHQQITIDNLYFWLALTPVLDNILWMYFTNFPMLFYPKNLLSKFGFSYPLGLFVDESCGISVENSLSLQDYDMFVTFAKGSPEVQRLNLLYESKPTLTEEEIIKTYSSKGKIGESVIVTYVREKAKYRAMREILSVNFQEKGDDLNSTDISLLKKVNSLSSFIKAKG